MYYPVADHREKLMTVMFEFDTTETEISLYQEAGVSLIKGNNLYKAWSCQYESAKCLSSGYIPNGKFIVMFVQLENHLALRSLPNTQPAQVINKVSEVSCRSKCCK